MSQCTISNQGDADKLNSTSCSEVIIQGATGVLNLTTLQYAGTITVNNNLALEMLYFPQLISLRTLAITNATALTDVSLPVFSTSPIEFVGNDSTFEGPVLDLYISNAPKLSKFELKNFTSCGNLALFDTAPITSHFTDNITAAHSVQIDSYITFLNLRDVGKLEIFSGPGYDYQLSSLRSAGNITISNANSFFALVFDTDPYFSIPSVQINDSLILSSSAPPDPTFSEGQILFGRIVTVGQNLNASSMSDLYLGFEGLTYIGGDLSLVGNTNCTWNFEGLTDIRGDLSLVGNNNCTWNFDHVTSAGSLIILDNQYTTVPLFPKLQTVQNIHLRGVINTSGGPNIFPALVLASGNVTVEAWNSDFNCSKLVSQWNDGLIHYLSCNGTDGPNTSSSNSAKPSGNDTLAPGALAGIGVGSGVFVLLVVVAIIWLVLHHKRQLKNLERVHPETLPNTGNQETTHEPDHLPESVIHEADGQDIIREKPHDPVLTEMPGSPVERELPTN